MSRDDTTSGDPHAVHAPTATPGEPDAIATRADASHAIRRLGVNAGSNSVGCPSAATRTADASPHRLHRTGRAVGGGSPSGSVHARQRARTRGMPSAEYHKKTRSLAPGALD